MTQKEMSGSDETIPPSGA